MMHDEYMCCVAGSSTSRHLFAQHDTLNYRWMFHGSNTSMSLIIARAPVQKESHSTEFSHYQSIHLPSEPLSLALHLKSFRIAIVCSDGQGILFSPGKSLSNDMYAIWGAIASWRCEPNTTTPIRWCESKDDLWLIGASSKITIWKVVDDAVGVYTSGSFDLGSNAYLFDTCSSGRYAATTFSIHSRVAKVWPLTACASGLSRPTCVFLGHTRAIKSIEWLNPGRLIMDNATLIVLDVNGGLAIWREDSNANTESFIRIFEFDADDHGCILSCSALLQLKPPPLTPFEATSSSTSMFKTSRPISEKSHGLYTHTMDRFIVRSTKAIGFSFRVGGTGDTHEGEKFIQGNLAIAKCTIVYLIYTVHEDGEIAIWRIDCTSFLTSTPRVSLLGRLSNIQQPGDHQLTILRATAVNFSNVPNSSFQAFITIRSNAEALHEVAMQLVSPATTTSIQWTISEKLIANMATMSRIHQVTWADNGYLLIQDDNNSIFKWSNKTERVTSMDAAIVVVAGLARDSYFCVSMDGDLVFYTDQKAKVLQHIEHQPRSIQSLLVMREDGSSIMCLVGVWLDQLLIWRLDCMDPLEPRILDSAVTMISHQTFLTSTLGHGRTLTSAQMTDTKTVLHHWRLTESQLTMESIAPSIQIEIGSCRLIKVNRVGCMAALHADSMKVLIQSIWDAVPQHSWTLDSPVVDLEWMEHSNYIMVVSNSLIMLYHVDGTQLWRHELHSTGIPSRLCISRDTIHPWVFISHGASVTRYLPPLQVRSRGYQSPESPLNPILHFHLLSYGGFKAVGRAIQSIADAVVSHEKQSYLEMKESSDVSFPWLSWKFVCFDESGNEDRSTFTKKKETASMLFAPRVIQSNDSTTKPIDFELIFNMERLQMLPDSNFFSSICKMIKLDGEASDLPGLRFLLHWYSSSTHGLSAVAILWCYLSKMDFFSLSSFQNLVMEWTQMQQLRLPFWLDDIQRLRQKTEQVAQRQYAATKDPFDIALYYVLLGKARLLSGLFRLAKEQKIADLLGNDFQEDRWKAAAIKNAFVLKSKQRYTLAATFFLLGGKIYEAASIAEAADSSLVLSFLILRLSEPSSLKDLGVVTKQFIQGTILDKAKKQNDMYMECLSLYLLKNQLILDPLLHLPKGDIISVFDSSQNCTTWKIFGSTLYGACQLIQHGWLAIQEHEEVAVLTLHCTAASRLHGLGYPYLSYSLLSNLSSISSLVELPQWSWIDTLRKEMSLSALENQLIELCGKFNTSLVSTIAQSTKETTGFSTTIQEDIQAAWSYFPHVSQAEMVDLLRKHDPVAWMLAAQWFMSSAEPIFHHVHLIVKSIGDRAFKPSMVLEPARALVLYLFVGHDESASIVRLATASIYTALSLAFPHYAGRMSRCCLIRLLKLMFPHKELGGVGNELCLACLEYKPQVLPSLRHDLSPIYLMISQLLTMPISSMSTELTCPYWTALIASIHDIMEQHVTRFTDQVDVAENLRRQWRAYYTPRVLVNTTSCSCLDQCMWQPLYKLLAPDSSLNFDPIPLPTNDEMISECIYKSDVPGESIRAMCCNTQQKNTVVFCNGRFLYRAVAKKPPKTSSSTSSCQLHVNAKYTPPLVFFAGESDQGKALTAAIMSPQPDSKGPGSYKPVAVQSHPTMPIFCSGTVKGSVEVWRFDQTSSCNFFEHVVPPVSTSLAPLTTPRRDIHRIRFANSGHILGACDSLGYVYLWNFASEGASSCYAHLQCHNRGTRDFVFLNASSCLASVGSSTKKKNVCLWDTLLPPHKALICAPECHPIGAASIVFSSRHQLLISGGESGALNIFDVRRQRVLHTVSSAHDSCITTLTLHPKGHCVLSGTANGDVKIWSLPIFREIANWATTKPKQPSFLGEASSFATNSMTVTGVTDAFATEDFFYTCSSDGIIQRYQTPIIASALLA